MKSVVSILLLVLLAGTQEAAIAKDISPTHGIGAEEFYDPFAEPEAKNLQDPLENLNRRLFAFNDFVYTRVVLPLCRALSPEVKERLAAVRAAVLKPLRIGHTDLEFAFRDGGSEAGRFVMHSVLEWLHVRDPEITRGLRNGEEDFGLMLQALGVDPGFYLVLPLFGPSSLRDGVGRVTAFYLDPSPRLCNFDLRRDLSADTSLAGALAAYEEIRRQSLDPYLFIRDAYAQQLASAERNRHLSRVAPSTVPHRVVHSAALL